MPCRMHPVAPISVFTPSRSYFGLIYKQGMAENGGSNSDQKMYLENLDEWINDENKLVTYKWLSRTLSLHVNHAKHLLDLFVQSREPPIAESTAPSGLSVTYCLAGLVRGKGDGGCVFTIRLVRGKDRRKVVAEFVPPVSCHVYSVQVRPYGFYGSSIGRVQSSNCVTQNYPKLR